MTDSSLQAAQTVQHIYLEQGTHTELSVSFAAQPDQAPIPTIANTVSVTRIMTREVQCARQDLSTERLIELMVRNRLGCMPIVNNTGCPVGMITKLDLIEQLLPNRNQPDVATVATVRPQTARELMMPIAITLGEQATVAQAAALMAGEGVHHLPIVGPAGRLVGILSTMDLVRWLAKNDGNGTSS